MKFSFSTLGCPDWTWGEILSAAKDIGYNGIELRGILEDIFMPKLHIFTKDYIGKTVEQLKGYGIEVACIATECYLHRNDKDYLAMTRDYIELAKSLNCKYIRVLGDTDPQPGRSVDKELVLQRLQRLAPVAEQAGVCMLVETNGVFANTADLKALIEKVNSPSVQVLWDINHPIRNFGEDVQTTYANIGKYVRHVHVKDSVMEDEKLTIKMLGYGNLPIGQCMEILRDNGYAGYISLEWTKRWNQELEDPAIVFEHFLNTIKRYV